MARAASSLRTARRLTRAFLDTYPEEAARVLEEAGPSEVARLLKSQTPRRAAAVLDKLSGTLAADVLAAMDEETARKTLEVLDAARAAMLLAALGEAGREQRLGLLPARTQRELRALLTYPADSAGALMDPRVAMSFHADTPVAAVFARMRTLRRRRIYDVFLVDEEGRLVGAVPLQDVVLAGRADRLRQLARGVPVSVPVTATREAVVETITDHRLATLPVVDYDGRLVGAIRHGALLAATSEEASADIQTMVGVSKEERALSKPLFVVRKRLPWLQINLLTAFLAASVVGMFEGTIARFTALAVLLPVVAGQSGNTGAQALAVTLRGLALREVRASQWLRIVSKEAAVGLINGLAVAAATCVAVFLWSGSPGLCVVIGLAMVLSMVIAGLAGAGIPILLDAVGQDPAQSSSIILTTITDVTGFLSFLGLATVLSRLL